MNYKPGICNFCGTGCGHLLNVDNGEINGVFASRNHPVSKGRLCVRGWHIHELVRSDDRITAPKIRKNGKLESVSYDEAISYAVEKMKGIKKPSEELGFFASPRSSNEENYLLMKLARSVFKTNNISIESESGQRNSLDVLYKGTGMAGMLGSLDEISKAEFIFVVGTDITKQNPIVGSEIHMAARNGATVVTLCSRKSQIAKLSDMHLQCNAGSKKIVLAAMAKSLIENKLYDADFVQKNTEGFEGFANSLGSLSDSSVESLTGLSLDDINSVVKKLSQAKTAMAFFSSGISGLDADTISYIYNLFVVAGKIGKEGCGVNPIAGIANLQGSYDMGAAPDLLTGFQSVKDQDAVKKFNKAWGSDVPAENGKDVYELLAAKKLKGLVVVDHDEIIVRQGDALKALDFVIYFGAFNNPFTEYADVVIPIGTYVESDGTFTNTDRRVQLSVKKVEPIDGIQPGWKVYTMVADKAGAKWNYNAPAAVMAEIASVTPTYAGISYDKFKGIGGIQWPCNDKYPQGCKRLALDDVKGKVKFVPVTANFKGPEKNDEYPFLLMTGKAQHFWHQNNLMRRTFIPMREYNATLLLYPNGYIEISPADAKNIQVRDRWPVKVVSPHGSMKVTVKITDDVKSETAYVPYFIQNMVSEFLMEHKELLEQGEDAIIPVRIEKV
ncbi:MAG TPA: molybdopterin-dependent oxidoreductase [Spirochaetota bacterium]|nr:molybdopterin-dependent oxidoreductase [Spirochaetota bacterium]HPI90056.1 molybdopterin-dependent oxidoreductase [Spirochaetota bacterium]HPR47843.1 molybdopterin-dependent oxidoreductase [Spirochaetota bacterium]